MILLNETNTPVETSLRGLFKEDEENSLNSITFFNQTITPTMLLIISIILSVITVITSSRKIAILRTGGGVPATGQLLVVVSALAAHGARIIALLAMFAPTMGLFSILGHWQMEQVPYDDHYYDMDVFQTAHGEFFS